MGKRKNKHLDEDRIVPRRRIKKQETVEQKNQNEQDEVVEVSEDESLDSAQIEQMIQQEEQEQQSEKSKQQKFFDKFKIEENTEVDEQNQKKRLSKITRHISIIHNETNIQDTYDNHFQKPHTELLESVIEEVIKEKTYKKTDKEQLRDKMKEIFNIGNEGGDIINPYKKHEEQKQKQKEIFKDFKDPVKEALNNKVEIHEYTLKKDLKDKKGYSIENVEEYQVDQLAQKYLKDGLNCSTENVHESIELGDLNQSEQIIFGAINNYHDLVYIDIEEKKNEMFRKLYCSHIMNHFTKAPLSKDIVEEIAEKEVNDKSKKQNKGQQKQQQVNQEDEDDEQENKRTKGYTNCKILILTPFKNYTPLNMNVFQIFKK